MSSGLLSQTDFENAYRFITADLSRKPSEAVDNIAKSIQCCQERGITLTAYASPEVD